MLFEVGRVIIKIAGRDSGNFGIVIDKIDDNYVLIDGYVRRKRCNVKHLEPTKDVVKIVKDASTSEVKKALESLNIKAKKEKKFIKNFKPKNKVAEKPQKVKEEKLESKPKKLKNNAK